MPCYFSGAFLVESIASSSTLNCVFVDDKDYVRKLTIIHYSNPGGGPFPASMPTVYAGKVYLMSGTFAVVNGNFISPWVTHFSLPSSFHDADLGCG
jgi:hypothetical protein